MDVDRFPHTALSTNTADETLSPRPVASPSYSTEDSWLVAEGLPVITGLVAGAGGAIYMSLCGASHDGTVTSIGSLSTRKRCRVPQVDPRREDFRSRTACEKRERASSAGRDKHAGATWGDGVGISHSEGKLARISSGFAATLAVDDDMNLFYITAERKGTCRALWCSVPGAGSRRVSSIRENFPTVRITAAGVPPKKIADIPAAIGRAERSIVSGDRGTESGGGNTGRAKDQTAQASAAAAVATKRAAALSSALAEDDEAVPASGPGRKSLFASRRRSTADKEYTDGDDGSGVGKEESNAPVNIAVVSRCRPLLTREMKRGVRAAVFCDGNEIIVMDERLPTKRSRRFGFDRVFGPRTSQARLYSEAVCPVVRKMLDGFNCSVLAYGQTGSGKTFTMEGGLVDPNIDVKKTAEADPDDVNATACEVEKVGIIPRAVHTIFREGGYGGTRRYWVYVSHMEIYNERLFDLLAPEAATLAKASATNSSAAPSSTSGRSRSPTHRSPRSTPGSSGSRPLQGIGLTIEEDRHLGVMVKGLTQVEVKSPEEIFAIIARSKNNRRTAETMCNVESSRSHGVFCVRVISAEPTPWGGEITRDGRLSLVDLSGSENIKRSGAVGDRAKEAAAIGQSLLALGRVIKALVKHAPHIPYRESKLTRVLGDSLGGNAFTAIILNITPNNGMLEETLNTLTYAKTAQSVRNTPKQHIANKAPTEKATIGTGDSSHLAPSSGVQNLSCNMVNELKRWRGDVKSRLLSSGSSRGAYISPWESQVPIDAPSHFSSTAGGRSPNMDGPSHQRRHNPSVLSSQPFADDVPSNQQGSGRGIAGDKVRKEVDRRRGTPIPSLPARVEFSLEDEGRRRSGSETNLLSPAETAGASGVTPRRGWRGGGAPTFTADARDGLVSGTLERMPSTTRPGYLQHDRNSLRGSRSFGPGFGGRSDRKENNSTVRAFP
ncbi:kinesin motor protein-related [Ectocarpus siliculosus]|uniref:Kinesin motor protein-related n=1 Tax=Ectocarpus siliculosus TaxID=2880 RepID=D7FQ29_ECTSI|nr:kinesin motor protein-related [Ectocarpus siliculosus]|eukprot:CBJ48361.1 kinesin motor protein-related [Ectocarpus siliculosus]